MPLDISKYISDTILGSGCSSYWAMSESYLLRIDKAFFLPPLPPDMRVNWLDEKRQFFVEEVYELAHWS